jgi:hypothetical protein
MIDTYKLQNDTQIDTYRYEPVAYLMVERNDGNSYIQMSTPTRDEKISHQPYPLYKHPVRELTDEEIAEIYHSEDRFSPQGNFAYYGFARAILRKAQE